MVNKIKNRHRVLVASPHSEIINNVLMLLSSHGYFVEIAHTYEELTSKMINYKPAILIADTDLLPANPLVLNDVFVRAKKRPVQMIIDRDEQSDIVQEYLHYNIDDLLTIPFDASALYRKVLRAAEYNRMQHELEYLSGMLFILKMIIPLIVVFVFILSTRGVS